MDITLKQFLEKADNIHDEIINKTDFLNTTKTKNRLYELESYIKQIQTISHRMAQIYNVCKDKLENGFVIHRGVTLKNVDPFPEKNNWSYMTKIPNKESKLLAPNIQVNVKQVKTIDEIPNTPLYWVSSLNQFALHVNGVIFRGNIGNIFVKNPRDSTNGHCIKKCKHKNKCTFLLAGKRCRFFHDPYDVYKLYVQKKITKETLSIYKILYRNYNSSSWIYTDDTPKKKNQMMRFVGNRNTLNNEIDMFRFQDKKWVENYQSQMFHDFLVLMAINQKHLIPRYPSVQMISEEYTGTDSLTK